MELMAEKVMPAVNAAIRKSEGLINSARGTAAPR